MNNRKKLRNYLVLGLILIVVSVLLVLVFFIDKNEDDTLIDKSKYSQVYLYDLGDSNIEIIIKNDFVILVNTGLEKDRDNLLDYFDKLGIEEIDYLILTNRDDKYIGNASYILEHFKVDYLYLNDYEYTSDSVNNLFNILSDSYTEKIILTSNEIITLDDLIINIYPYMESNFSMEDKTFIVNIIEGDNSIYLTSNASSKRLNEINKGTLLVSENQDILDKKSDYYIYDGNSNKGKSSLLNRNISIYMNGKEFIIE